MVGLGFPSAAGNMRHDKRTWCVIDVHSISWYISHPWASHPCTHVTQTHTIILAMHDIPGGKQQNKVLNHRECLQHLRLETTFQRLEHKYAHQCHGTHTNVKNLPEKKSE